MVAVLSYVPILVLGIAGIIRTRDRWRSLFPVYAHLLTLTVLYSVFLPAMRYRPPIDFFLIVFASHTLVRAFRRGPFGHRKGVAAG